MGIIYPQGGVGDGRGKLPKFNLIWIKLKYVLSCTCRVGNHKFEKYVPLDGLNCST